MVVPKAKGEILGVVIVESGWGSMLPTIVLANLSPTGPAARCGQLNIGDQVRSPFCALRTCKSGARRKWGRNASLCPRLDQRESKTNGEIYSKFPATFSEELPGLN